MRHPRRILLMALLSGALLQLVWLGWVSGGDGVERPGPRPRVGGEGFTVPAAPVFAAPVAPPGSSAPPGPAWIGANPVLAPLPGASRESGAAGKGAATHRAAAREDLARPLAAAPALVLDPPRRDPTVAAAAFSGFDPEGPRRLRLWRRVGDDWTAVGEGASDARGALLLPDLAVPARGLDLVVAPEGVGPEHPAASPLRHVDPPDPAPPVAVVLADSGEGLSLRVVPREAGGDVLLAAADGTLIERFPLVRTPAPAQRPFELDVSTPAREPVLLIAHELPDGRRSVWIEIPRR